MKVADLKTLGDSLVSQGSSYTLSKVLDKFGSEVIQRWSKHRAEYFFQVFCSEVNAEAVSGEVDSNVDVLWDIIFEKESYSETLFDAYRSVCFAKSKNHGPKIIGLLTAKLINENRVANDIEETFFLLAEVLGDPAFISFYEVVSSLENEFNLSKKEVRLELDSNTFDSNWSSNEVVSLGAIDLKEHLGAWAFHFKNHGLIRDDTEEEIWPYSEDSERHIDEPGTLRKITSVVFISPECFEFLKLVKRVFPQ